MLGALYLAYDLLGGEHGPLRVLTRAVTYGVLFGSGYGLALGPVFGLASGIAHGISLAWEFSRASRHATDWGFWRDTAMSGIRRCGFAVGASYLFGVPFGITFGMLSTAGQAYSNSSSSGLNRTAGYAVAGYLEQPGGGPARTRHRGRPENGSHYRRGDGDCRLLCTVRRMGGRSCARKTNGRLWRGVDPNRLRASIAPVLGGVSGCRCPVGVWAAGAEYNDRRDMSGGRGFARESDPGEGDCGDRRHGRGIRCVAHSRQENGSIGE